MRVRRALQATIPPVGYKPPAGYNFDIEVLPASALMSRVNSSRLNATTRIQFHQVIYVTTGRFRHMADFQDIHGKGGSVVIMRPGQVQQFDARLSWDGWSVLFRPEFYLPKQTFSVQNHSRLMTQLEELPTHLALDKLERKAVEESIERMFLDAQIKEAPETMRALLQTELHALLIRLQLMHEQRQLPHRTTVAVVEGFRQYRLAVERNLHKYHHVSDYARQLGRSEKTLSRAALEVAGMTAKRYLSERIALEAKRLLAHTEIPVSLIADKLGFDEATNFVKFFRRETGLAPGDFRKRTVLYA